MGICGTRARLAARSGAPRARYLLVDRLLDLRQHFGELFVEPGPVAAVDEFADRSVNL
jgi:hypothetical protein